MRKRRPLLVLTAVLAVATLALARVDRQQIGRALAMMSWQWAVAAAVVNLLGVVLDAARWRVIVNSVGRLRFWHACQAQLTGIVGNVLFPFKLGEGVRAYVLTRCGDLPASTALTTVLLDRIIDGLTLPLFIVASSLVLPLPPAVAKYRPQMALVVVAAAAVGFGAALLLRRRWARTGARTDDASGTFDRVLAGLSVLSHHGRAARTIGIALLSWIARAAIVWCMLRAFHLDLPASAAVGTLVVINLAIVAVATPGNVGSFELATAAALALWGVPTETAVSLGVAMHVVEVAPPVLLGISPLGGWHLTLSQLRRRSLDGTVLHRA